MVLLTLHFGNFLNTQRKQTVKKKLLALATFALALFAGTSAHAALVNWDLFTDSQFVSSTGAVSSDTIPNPSAAAAWFGSRTISVQRTSGTGTATSEVDSGSYSCNSGNNNIAFCELSWMLDSDVTVDSLMFTANTDLTGVGNATMSFWNGATMLWSHVMMSATESINIPFASVTFQAGDTLAFKSTGTTGFDLSDGRMVADVPENRVPEPASLALVGLALVGMTSLRTRKQKR
jgi:hypothetical protein